MCIRDRIWSTTKTLTYQDHATKFYVLHTLKTNYDAEVSFELLNKFLDFVAPHILQSNNGCDFSANVIQKLKLCGQIAK